MSSLKSSSIVNLAGHAKIKEDSSRGITFLLVPERAVKLNDTAASILVLCDGSSTLEEINSKLEEKYKDKEVAQDLTEFLNDMLSKGWLEIVGEKS